jgi:hypothetical protein
MGSEDKPRNPNLRAPWRAGESGNPTGRQRADKVAEQLAAFRETAGANIRSLTKAVLQSQGQIKALAEDLRALAEDFYTSRAKEGSQEGTGSLVGGEEPVAAPPPQCRKNRTRLQKSPGCLQKNHRTRHHRRASKASI